MTTETNTEQGTARQLQNTPCSHPGGNCGRTSTTGEGQISAKEDTDMATAISAQTAAHSNNGHSVHSHKDDVTRVTEPSMRADAEDNTEDTKRAQAAAYVESLATILANPITPTGFYNEIGDEANDLLNDSCRQDIVADLRFNSARIVDWMVARKMNRKPLDVPTDDATARYNLHDGETGGPLSIDKIDFDTLTLGQINDCDLTVRRLLSDDGDPNEPSEHKVNEFCYFLETLDEATTPGELLSLIRHAWYRVAVEMQNLKNGPSKSSIERFPKLSSAEPAPIYREPVKKEPEATSEAPRPAEPEPQQEEEKEDSPEDAGDYVNALAVLLSNSHTPDELRRTLADVSAGLIDNTNGDLSAILFENASRIADALSKKANN